MDLSRPVKSEFELLEQSDYVNYGTTQATLFSSIEDALNYQQAGTSNSYESYQEEDMNVDVKDFSAPNSNTQISSSDYDHKNEISMDASWNNSQDDRIANIRIFNEAAKMETVFSSRGKPKLVLDGAMFTLFRVNKDEHVCWRCDEYRKDGCKVRAITLGNDLVELRGLHTHAIDPSRVVAQKIRNTAKLTAMIAPSERTKEIMERSMEQVSPFGEKTRNKMTNLTRLISRYKKAANVKPYALTSMDTHFPTPSELQLDIRSMNSVIPNSLNAILPDELQQPTTSYSIAESLTKLAAEFEPTIKFPQENMTRNLKLLNLRQIFKKHGIIAYVLPRTDPHQSEYLCERDERVKFISGFSGSNAYTIITEEKALLWTDGRYFLQAEKEFEEGWSLMKEAVAETISPLDWLIEHIPLNSNIGFDPQLFGYANGAQMVESLNRVSIKALPINQNLVDEIWTDRPKENYEKLIALKREEHGEDSLKKIERVREKLVKKKCDTIILTMLDDIAWLLNIRGFDIPFNPTVISYVVITSDEVLFFIEDKKLTPELYEHLSHVKIRPYHTIGSWLKEYHESAKISKPAHKVFIPDTTNYFIGSIIGRNFSVVGPSPVQAMKAIKNNVELSGMRNSHIRDSAAHVRFLLWLKKQIDSGSEVDELKATAQFHDFRKAQSNFVMDSFETIPAVGDHAAFPHYKPTEETGKRVITKDSVFLVDSGGQYRDGTTDVTRTVFHGQNPGEYFKKMFTLVLKGHIENALMTFPSGISGIRLDILARSPLWLEGYDFGHGVGHGVGHFLNVHEGPRPLNTRRIDPLLLVSIGYRTGAHPEGGFYAGQVVTIEPGYYEEGKWGIRIENCYEVVKAPPLASGAENFLTFSPLTLVPIQKSLIKKELLENRHIEWLNNYHKKCLNLVGPYLQKNDFNEEYDFLVEACQLF